MTRAPLRERSLAAVNPAVAGQLHPTRNGPLTAQAVSAGSPARLWWACPHGHEWQAAVKSRTRGSGCPYCSGRLPTEQTCLAARHPALAADWHPDRNTPVTPRDVLPTTRAQVWWRCARCAHEWSARVVVRSCGAGCPSCPREKPTTLLNGHPDLAAQWIVARNGALQDSVTAGSDVRAWWRCGHGHEWRATVAQRTRGQGCPYCAGKRATPQTSVAALRPHLMTQWAHDLNGDLDPATVLPTSSVLVWWRCTSEAHHVWQVSLRNRGSRATSCPFCTGTSVTPEGSLAAMRPDLAVEWDTARNGAVEPGAVAPRSRSMVWWRCPAGHQWQARVDDRTGQRSGCPYCQGSMATETSSLAATAPALAAEWDTVKNGDLSPSVVLPFSNKRVWWRCPAGHSWRAQIGQRSRAHTGCPHCSSSSQHGRLLASTRPDLAVQWFDPLNNGGPGDVTAGSHVKAWWRCAADPTHLWAATISNRTRSDTGCPYCTHKLPTSSTCLAAAAPQLISEWHPVRNDALSPTDLLPKSAIPVWWRCGDQHEWRATPAARLRGHGCPDCASRRRRRNRSADPHTPAS